MVPQNLVPRIHDNLRAVVSHNLDSGDWRTSRGQMVLSDQIIPVPKCVGPGLSGSQVTPHGQSSRAVLLDDFTAVEVTVVVEDPMLLRPRLGGSGSLVRFPAGAPSIAFLASDESGLTAGSLVDFDRSVLGAYEAPPQPAMEP